MNTIIPRWEWRTFGHDFGEAETALAASAPEGVQDSDEIYLLSPVCDANVKVRHGLLDIKRLEQVNAAGLEQWCPVTKGTFPLSAEAVTKVCEILGVVPPSPARAVYSLEELGAELIAPGRGVRVVPVHKRRVRYRIRGCMAEITDVTASGNTTRTLALEAEDPRQVIGTVRALGLATLPNTSYPRGLKQLIGMIS